MSRATILHISDLHISQFPQLMQFQRRSPGNYYDAIRNGIYAASHGKGKLTALVNLVHNLRATLDAILITGDIATTGLGFDLEKALLFVEGQPDAHEPRTSAGFPTVRGAGLPIHLLPGNHDRYKLLLKRLGYAPGSKKFHQIFHRHWQQDVKVNAIIKPGLAIGIIAADFSLRRWHHAEKLPNLFVNAHAQGRVYPDILAQCVAETETFQAQYEDDKEVFIIWAIHFPPAPAQAESYMRLIDREDLIAAADGCGVALVLSGHTHEPFEFSSPQYSFRVFGTGSATQYDSPEGNFCQIVSIETAEGGFAVETKHYRFEEAAGTGRFVRVAAP
jgi:3',5'-cyclic AMP phosphodiesterase CpdA